MTNLNIRQTLSLTSEVRDPITKVARDSLRSVATPVLTDRPLERHFVSTGFNFSQNIGHSQTDDSHASTAEVAQTTQPVQLNPVSQIPMAAVSYSSAEGSTALSALNTPATIVEVLSRQSVDAFTTLRQPPHPIQSHKTCQPHRCAKCGRMNCSSWQNWKLCHNGCQDCGLNTCKGRNAKRLTKKCDEAWI